MDVRDITGDVKLGMAMCALLKGRTGYQAMRVLAAVVAAIYTDGEPVKDSPPESMERLYGRLCTAGRMFKAESATHPVLAQKESE